MVNQHEIKVSINKFENMKSNDKYIITENKGFKQNDYCLVRKDSKETEEVMLCKVEFAQIEDGLQDGFVLLQLRKID